MNKQVDFFNLRVYALILEKDMILLSKELIKNKITIKFPGGGVELGEGIKDALQRESIEELGQKLTNIEHYYTTDYFQHSFFNPKDQLISIYYKASLSSSLVCSDIQQPLKDQPVFFWKKINTIKSADLHFPIDRFVLDLLQKQ